MVLYTFVGRHVVDGSKHQEIAARQAGFAEGFNRRWRTLSKHSSDFAQQGREGHKDRRDPKYKWPVAELSAEQIA
jgi:hypothetical protein